MPLLIKGKTNWKLILTVLILAIIVGGGILGYLKYFEREMLSLTKFPEIKKPEKVIEKKPEKYFCQTDTDCEIKRVNCSGCDFDLECVNREWNHCELQPLSGQSCPPPAPSPFWPKNCECFNSKCVSKEIIGEADWKIYRNKEYKFKVKYPSNLSFKEYRDDFWHGKIVPFLVDFVGANEEKGVNFVIVIKKIDAENSFEALKKKFSSLRPNAVVPEMEEIEIGEHHFIRWRDGYTQLDSYFTEKGDNFFEISITEGPRIGAEKTNKRFLEIISTFRFLD